MTALWIALGVAGGLLLIALAVSFICYKIVFYSAPRVKSDEIPTPPGEEYDPYREDMKKWVLAVRAMPHDDIEIKSRDGVVLRAKYYEHSEGAPIELMMHGYRGNAERDLSAGVLRAFKLGRSVLLVDHRGSGDSGGKTITFGVKEREDCLLW
jgi:predicted acyl esterase